jgi:hypothetical protein
MLRCGIVPVHVPFSNLATGPVERYLSLLLSSVSTARRVVSGFSCDVRIACDVYV